MDCSPFLWRRAAAGLLVLGLLGGCLGPRAAKETPPDERFGHRYDAEAPDGRRTISITPPDSAVAYFFYPVPFDTVLVRPAPFAAAVPAQARQVGVEVLVKGAFPDACSELHAFRQERAENILLATLEMRKPQESICASVRRPYRFYVMLEGHYGVGHYTLKLNGRAVPFEIRAPSDGTR